MARRLVMLAVVAVGLGAGCDRRSPGAAPSVDAAGAAFWCEKQPSYTDVRVCLPTAEKCRAYGLGDCFSQSGASCVWRQAVSGGKTSICTATREECERNLTRIPADANPTPCFDAKSPKEVE